MIDIGGPAMVRAAAKNFGGVAVVVDPRDYAACSPVCVARRVDISAGSAVGSPPRPSPTPPRYDAAWPPGWLDGPRRRPSRASSCPNGSTLSLARESELRYGENPHQAAAVYRRRAARACSAACASSRARSSPGTTCSMPTPRARSSPSSTSRRWSSSSTTTPAASAAAPTSSRPTCAPSPPIPVSAFGSIVALNRPTDGAGAGVRRALRGGAARSRADEEARDLLAAKKNLRLLTVRRTLRRGRRSSSRSSTAGFLAQPPDAVADEPRLDLPDARPPTADERRALDFAWVVRATRSRTRSCSPPAMQTVGIGAGQMSRVDSCRLAIEKAQVSLCRARSPPPTPSSLSATAWTSWPRPGSSPSSSPAAASRDDEIIAAADEHGMAMLFTGQRHFRH